MLLSVVIPCFNEALVIADTKSRLTAALEHIGEPFELVFVDDGSKDTTRDILATISEGDPRCRLIALSRNFGHQMAFTAGVDQAAGDAVVLMDADLQDPPEVIQEMLRLWREGYQVVYGMRLVRRGESVRKRATASLFYRILNGLSGIDIPSDTGDFRLIDRRVVSVLGSMPERDRYLRGMVSWVGFRQIAVPFERDPRFAGVTKYSLGRMLHLALDGITSFSTAPLRLVTMIGLGVATMSMLGVLVALYFRLFTHAWVPGWAGLIIAILFLGGVQLTFLGVIGEYVGRVYGEVKRRPLYVIDDLRSIRASASTPP